MSRTLTATADYQRQVSQSGIATARGIALTDEDRMRGWVIERLMCDFAFSRGELVRKFGKAADTIVGEAHRLAGKLDDRLIEESGDLFVVSRERRPLVRAIAAKFDNFLSHGSAKHSAAV